MNSTLVTIRPRVSFDAPAAASFVRIEAHLGRPASVNRTTVPYNEQAALYAEYLAGRYPHLVLDPDISQHVYRGPGDGGNAWDTEERGSFLDDHGWLIVNRAEPWHREYFTRYDKHRSTPAPKPPTDQEEPMIVNIQGKAGARAGGAYYLTGNTAKYIGTNATPNVAGAPTVDFEQGTKLLSGMTVK